MNLPLSICIIAKNEEKNIVNLLESIRHLSAEIIVVDTGSNDKTKEIARSYGAKVYDFPWQDDFSLARNESLKYATKDWILVMEADSVFVKESSESLINCLNDKTIDLYFVRWIEGEPGRWTENASDAREIRPRSSLFKNNPGIKYTGRIHEELNIDLNKYTTRLSNIYILHYGYSESTWSEEKLKRNERLLKQRLAEHLNPEDKLKINSYLLTHQITFSQKDYPFPEMKQKIFGFNNKLKKSDSMEYRPLFENFYKESGNFLIKNNQIKDAFKIISDGTEVCPYSLSLLKLLSRLYILDKNDFFKSVTILTFISYLVKVEHIFCHYYTTDVQLFEKDYLNYLQLSLYYEFGFYEAVIFHLQKISTQKFEKLYSNILNVMTGRVSVFNSLSKEAKRLGDDSFTYFRLAREMLRENHNKTDIINTYFKALDLSKNKNKSPQVYPLFVSDPKRSARYSDTSKNIRNLIRGDLLANSIILGLSPDFTESLIMQVKNSSPDNFYGRYSLGLYYFSIENCDEAKKEFVQAKNTLDNKNFFMNKNDYNTDINNLIKQSVKDSYFYNVISYYLGKIS